MPKRPRSAIDAESPPLPSSTARICVGSYDHILYGIDAVLSTSTTASADNDSPYSVHFTPIYMFEAHTAQIKTCAIGGRYLASGGVDEVLKLYDLKNRKDLGSLLSHDGTITSISFPPPLSTASTSPASDASGVGPSHMLSSDANNRIIIWRVKDWTPQIQITTRHGTVNDISIHPSGKICLSVGSDRTIRLWNLVTGKKAGAYKLSSNASSSSAGTTTGGGRRGVFEEGRKVKWNASGSKYAVLFDSRVAVYDMSASEIASTQVPASGRRYHDFSWLSIPSSSSRSSRSPNAEEEGAKGEGGEGMEMVVASMDSGAIQLLTQELKQVQLLTSHKTRVKAVSVHYVTPSPDPHADVAATPVPVPVLFTASTDGDVKVWTRRSASGGENDEEGEWVVLGTWNCGESRISCMAVCDAQVEDLESVVRRRQRVMVKEEEVSDDEAEVLGTVNGGRGSGGGGGEVMSGDQEDEEDEAEEFTGFD